MLLLFLFSWLSLSSLSSFSDRREEERKPLSLRKPIPPTLAISTSSQLAKMIQMYNYSQTFGLNSFLFNIYHVIFCCMVFHKYCIFSCMNRYVQDNSYLILDVAHRCTYGNLGGAILCLDIVCTFNAKVSKM